MSALQQYLAAVRRQYDFLERARDMDERMAELEPPPPPYYNGRRHWTHQDQNLVKWGDLSEEERIEFLWSTNPPRMQRRISYAVSRCRRNLEPAKSAALAEAGQMGGFDTLAPLIVEMFRAHDHLCANYAHELDEQEIDWNEAESRHAEALQRLAEFVPIEEVPEPAKLLPPRSEAGVFKTRDDTDSMILTALIEHHSFRDGKALNRDPVVAARLAAAAKVSPAAVSGYWKRKFKRRGTDGDYQAYQHACRNGQIEFVLAQLNGDLPALDVHQAIRSRRGSEDD